MKPKHGKLVTCAEAVEFCKQVGALIFWRPNGAGAENVLFIEVRTPAFLVGHCPVCL